jgi:hypothetical protein
MGSRSHTLTWLALGVGGLAVAAVGARVYAGAIDGYIASNPFFYRDFYNVPAPSEALSRQAILGTSLLLTGCAVAAVAAMVRLRTTKRRWLVLRGVAAGLSSLLLVELGLKGWFQLVVNTICGDCGPPSPPNPPWTAFSVGADVVAGAILVGFALCLLLVIVAIRRRSGRPMGGV